MSRGPPQVTPTVEPMFVANEREAIEGLAS